MKEPFLHEITVQTTRLKIELISTHDPLLALLCPKRILTQLEQIDSYQSAVRHALRNGETLPENPSWIEEELYVSL